MTTLRLPRMLAEAANAGTSHEVAGSSVEEALMSLFEAEPGLRGHILDESGAIRPHVSVFAGGVQATLGSPLAEGAEIRILQAVSGG